MIGIIIGVIAVIVILALIVVFASRKSLNNNSKPTLKKAMETLTPEQAEVFEKGQAQLSELKKQFIKLKNNDVRTAGMKVCSRMDQVFKILKEKLEKIPSSRQFLNYYIPTVTEVVKKYQWLEANGVPADDMTVKIKKYLSDVEAAMDKQCQLLYEDDKFDMSVDMEAMTNAIKRDGLLDDDFSLPKTHAGGNLAQDISGVAYDFTASNDININFDSDIQPPELDTPVSSEIKLELPGRNNSVSGSASGNAAPSGKPAPALPEKPGSDEPLFTTDEPLFTAKEKEKIK